MRERVVPRAFPASMRRARRRPRCSASCSPAAAVAAAAPATEPSPKRARGAGHARPRPERRRGARGPALGFPVFATKNTTRVGGADPVANAAAVARAVFPRARRTRGPRRSRSSTGRLARGHRRRALAAAPVGAPVLLTEGDELPAATQDALDALAPTGAREAGDAQVIRIGDVRRARGPASRPTSPARTRSRSPRRSTAAVAAARERTSDRVVVASAERPELRDARRRLGGEVRRPGALHRARRAAAPRRRRRSQRHQQPKIYVLGGPRTSSPRRSSASCAGSATVKRIDGPATRSTNAIAFARYVDGRSAGASSTPGHGLVFVNAERPLDAAAAAPLSASGTYGPLLLVHGRPGAPAAARGATCSTSSRATAGTRCAGSTITAG